MDKKFIITDPCYIMDRKQYKAICDDNCDFEGKDFPSKSTHRYGGKEITFHTIQRTPNGDGSYTFRGQKIGVDAGLLCIAECDTHWEAESHGATFSTLKAAQNNFDQILSKF